jgi:isoleucyl-tRNA synthetase
MLAASRTVQLYKKEGEFAVESRHVGRDLQGLKYTPIFDYFVASKADTSYRVLIDTYVTDSSGTGVVHQARAILVA